MTLTDKKVSNSIKGIAAVMIMLGHLVTGMHPVTQMLFSGEMWVGVFFFFSGYGLMHSLCAKGDSYLEHFLVKKILHIWLPFVVAESIYTIASVCMTGDMAGIIPGCLGIHLFNSVLWYVDELMILNILFFAWGKLIYRHRKEKMTSLSVWVLLYVLFLMLGVCFDIGTWWYISTSTFVIGIYIAYIKNSRPDLEARVGLSLPMEIIVTTAFVAVYVVYRYIGLLYHDDAIFGLPVSYVQTGLAMILVPWFVLTIAILIKHIPKHAIVNSITEYLGDVSYDIYLYHGLAILLIDRVIFNMYIRLILAVMLTLICAVVIRVVKSRKTK